MENHEAAKRIDGAIPIKSARSDIHSKEEYCRAE